MTTTDDQHRVDPATGTPAASTGPASAARTRVRRQIPRVRDLAPLLQFKKPTLPGRRQRLDSALTIWDLRAIAARRTPRAAFDYTEGAAEAEISLARARQAFEDIEFTPAILRDVSHVDTSRDILGAPTALPFGIAPTGFTRMMQTEGERAGARAAGRAGIPFSLSTMGTTAIEDVKAANPHGRNWFQLYMWKDRDKSMALVDRAAKAGFDTLLVTVDVPVAGARLRDKRNGFSIPPQLGVKTIVNAIPRPWWWFDFLTTEPLAFASLDRWSGTVGELLDHMFDPTVTYEDLAWIRDQWPGKVVVKGVQSLDDAKRLTAMSVDGITLSNHGGRQLDRAPVPFHLLPSVVKEVGADTEVHLDTGIMSGADIIAAIALGAKFTMVGRAYLYGLMAGGEAGVDRMIQILSDQIERTMRLLGVATLDELRPGHVTQLQRLTPIPR
ncbi:alpha-hydroxy acid oxidase [Curtobacterium sp. B8]|uniref:alpha-hydroxy acid oxidase n=1 Tax=Curtobacterium sp. B8 TaxID=95611 RepID=UPI000346ED77|nr:alpha-hydroxy acid oxidase [Curtobacterium sp. B8]